MPLSVGPSSLACVSKVDALRAMREARFASYQAKPAATRPAGAEPATERPARAAKTARPAKAKAAEVVTDGPEGDADAAAATCGHRNMSGKECSRPAGHAEKNHRYGR